MLAAECPVVWGLVSQDIPGSQDIKKQRKEVIHEATVMLQLGSHPGLLLLFRIQSKVAPFSDYFAVSRNR